MTASHPSLVDPEFIAGALGMAQPSPAERNQCVISLFDYSGVMLEPWREAGFKTIAVDMQHPNSVAKIAM